MGHPTTHPVKLAVTIETIVRISALNPAVERLLNVNYNLQNNLFWEFESTVL